MLVSSHLLSTCTQIFFSWTQHSLQSPPVGKGGTPPGQAGADEGGLLRLGHRDRQEGGGAHLLLTERKVPNSQVSALNWCTYHKATYSLVTRLGSFF